MLKLRQTSFSRSSEQDSVMLYVNIKENLIWVTVSY
jgi:hypothetical protein